MGRGPLAPRRWISPRTPISTPLSFHDLPWHAEWATPSPTMPGTPLIPDWPRGYSHILGGQRPALHDADVQGAALGHGAQPQTFRPGGRPGSEAGPRQGGRLHVTRSEPGTLSRSPRASCPKRAGSWTGGFRRRREDSDRGGGASLPGLYR